MSKKVNNVPAFNKDILFGLVVPIICWFLLIITWMTIFLDIMNFFWYWDIHYITKIVGCSIVFLIIRHLTGIHITDYCKCTWDKSVTKITKK